MKFKPFLLLVGLIAASILGLFWVFHNHIDDSVVHTQSQSQDGPVGLAKLELSSFRGALAHADVVAEKYFEGHGGGANYKERALPASMNNQIKFLELKERRGDKELRQQAEENQAMEREQRGAVTRAAAGGASRNGHMSDVVGTSVIHKQQSSRSASASSSSSSASPAAKTTSAQGGGGGGGGATMDVIIGMAHEIDPKNLAVFCGSVRDDRVCPSREEVEVIIFANEPVSPLYKEIAAKYGVTLIPFNLKNDFAAAFHNYHPSTLRWALIHDYLQTDHRRDKYRRIWLADARDTWFQLNPFPMLQAGTKGFLAFKGVENLLIKDCGWNGGWVKDCFGAAELSDIGDNNIICSGVSVGDTETVMVYLEMMANLINGKARAGTAGGLLGDKGGAPYQKVSARAKFPACERNGVDQGVHNVLVYEGAIPALSVKGHRTGLVANLQAQKSKLQLSAANLANRQLVLNGQDEPVSVVHQYDRKPALQQMLFAKYVTWVKVGDFDNEWGYEKECAAFTYKRDVDYFKKRCDLKMRGGATSAASCCKYCAEQENCQSFTFYSSVCFLKTCTGPHGARNGQGSGGASLPGAVSGWMKTA